MTPGCRPHTAAAACEAPATYSIGHGDTMRQAGDIPSEPNGTTQAELDALADEIVAQVHARRYPARDRAHAANPRCAHCGAVVPLEDARLGPDLASILCRAPCFFAVLAAKFGSGYEH